MSGSGGDAGYDYQAKAIAFVASHGLSGQRLRWFEDFSDVPVRWSAETGGIGDDLNICGETGVSIEVQAKHGFTRGDEYNKTLVRMLAGLCREQNQRAVLLVDRHASEI